jgi:hypothetical protein
VEVPVQYFQSVVGVEVAVVGALLWQIRYFDQDETARRAAAHRPHPVALILLAVVLAATLFGSLWGILHHGRAWAASAVTAGLAISILPILLRVLPPIARNAQTHRREPGFEVTVAGILGYVVVVTAAIVLLNV